MKKVIAILIAIFVFGIAAKAHAQYYTFGLGPMGNFFVVDAKPNLSPGVGGYLFFDYRWNPQISTQISVMVTTEDGTGPDKGDKGIEFLGIPTLDVKYYLISNVTKIDPYLLLGVGVYAITQGTITNGTTAVGVGANIGFGADYYFSDRWSMGLTASFRSIGLIDSTKGSNNGTAIFPVSVMGNVGYHF